MSKKKDSALSQMGQYKETTIPWGWLREQGVSTRTLEGLLKDGAIAIEVRLIGETTYQVQRRGGGDWLPVLDEHARPIETSDQETAESIAGRLSVLNEGYLFRIFKAAGETDDDTVHVVFTDGQRYLEDDGELIRHPRFVVTDDVDEDAMFFVVQRLIGETWETRGRLFSDYSAAARSAAGQSERDPDHDYRVSYHNTTDLPATMWRSGQSLPNVHLLSGYETLTDAISLFTSHRSSAIISLCRDALHDPVLKAKLEEIIE